MTICSGTQHQVVPLKFNGARICTSALPPPPKRKMLMILILIKCNMFTVVSNKKGHSDQDLILGLLMNPALARAE
jgi:hypothetical protein